MRGAGSGAGAPRTWGHVGALDGLRALAVLSVIGFHSGIPWLSGGYYGVDIFFALSGFLITSLLVSEWEQSATVSLRRFWSRRARRLLPALFLLLAFVGLGAVLWPAVLGSPQLVGDTASTVGYVANWHFILAGSNYFSQLNTGSALTHTWTLSIEEQFYVIWPLVLLVILGVRRSSGRSARRRLPNAPAPEDAAFRRRRLQVLLVLSCLGAVASAIWMAVLAPVGSPDTIRAYFGTDTQAQCLLIGAALAALTALRRSDPSAGERRALAVVGVLGAAGLAVMCSRVPSSSALAFHGGFALVALCTAAVIATAFHSRRHVLSRFLELPPMRYIGRISYGMYLWYLPILMIMSAARTHVTGYPLAAERLGVIVVVASLSYHFLEVPIRRGALAGWRGRLAVPTGAALAISVAVVGAALAPVQASLASAPVAAATLDAHGAPPGPPVRILLVGDSMAGSLGVGLASDAPHFGAVVINRGSPGCSLSMDQQVKVLWFTDPPGVPCKEGDPAALMNQLRTWVRAYNPDVVVYLARSDTLNQELHGRWTNLGDPAFDAWYAARLDQAVGALSSEGARVVLLTTPYYNPGEQPNGTSWPENQPSRVSVDNAIIARVAETHAQLATVINLNTMVSPEKRYQQSVHGVPVRCLDGVHITIPGGRWLGEQLLPRLVALGQAHLLEQSVRSRAAVRAGSSPAWYGELPCAQ